MTKSKLTFDFNRAVADARRDYPEETKDVTFVNLSAQNAQPLLTQWIKSASHEYKNPILKKCSEDEFVVHMLRLSGFADIDPFKKKGLIAILEIDPDSSFSNHFKFNHELGHIVVPGGMSCPLNKKQKEILKGHVIAENIADSFAVIYGFKQKTMTKEEAGDVMSIRVFSIGEKHDTYRAVQALLQNNDHIDFKSLTPQDVKVLAAAHAKKYTPGVSS